jgi:RHS repeat-associated protein
VRLRERYRRSHKTVELVSFVAGLFERRQKADGSLEHTLRVLGPASSINDGPTRPLAEFVYTAPSASAPPTREKRFLHADPLGSPDVVTTADGPVLERRSYEPFGARRDPTWSNPTPPSEPGLTNVGFTGHEDDTELGLVNMGGRLYDPKLARFLQPDALVQAPGFSQSWNPYGYVWHSPLRYTDPTGWQVEGGSAEQGPPLPARDEMISDAQATAEAQPPDSTIVGPWANGTETTGPAPYGAQPQAAPAAPPAQPTWSFYADVASVLWKHRDSFPTYPGDGPLLAAAAAAGARFGGPALGDAALNLAARSPGAFQALSELAVGLLEGEAGLGPGALAAAGAGAAALGERAAGQAEGAGGRALGRLGGWLRSLSTGGGESAKSAARSAARISENVKCYGKCSQFADRLQNALLRKGISGTRIKIEVPKYGQLLSDTVGPIGDPGMSHAAIRVGDTVFDNFRPTGIPYQQFLDDLGVPTAVRQGVVRITESGFFRFLLRVVKLNERI